MLIFISRRQCWDIVGRRDSPARSISGGGVETPKWNLPQGYRSSVGTIIIPLWFFSLNLVEIFLQSSWPPNQSPHVGLCTTGLLPHPAPGLPMCAYITSCWSPAPPPFPCPATPDQLRHGQASKHLCSLVGQTTCAPRRSKPVPDLPFLRNNTP